MEHLGLLNLCMTCHTKQNPMRVVLIDPAKQFPGLKDKNGEPVQSMATLDDYTGSNVAWVTHERGLWVLQACFISDIGSEEADTLREALISLKDNGLLTNVQRRSDLRKEGIDVGGWVRPDNNTTMPGQYKLQADNGTAGSQCITYLNDLAATFTRMFSKQVNDFMDEYRDVNVGILAHSRFFTSFSHTTDYHNRYHYDINDGSIGGIFWFQRFSAYNKPNGYFHMLNLHARFSPRHGSVLLLRSRSILHGSAPGPERTFKEHPMIGCALFSKPRVLRDVSHSTQVAIDALNLLQADVKTRDPQARKDLMAGVPFAVVAVNHPRKSPRKVSRKSSVTSASTLKPAKAPCKRKVSVTRADKKIA